jgi:hypothetical protein
MIEFNVGDVMIVASGYATDALWLAAIAAAVKAGRAGVAVTREGEKLTLAEALASAC